MKKAEYLYTQKAEEQLKLDFVTDDPDSVLRSLCRFAQNIKRNDKNNCFEWQAHLNSDGYAIVCFLGAYMTGHRFAYQTFVGPIPEGKIICHKCNNPKCVRPSHLYAGTVQDNGRDKTLAGSHRKKIGKTGKRDPNNKCFCLNPEGQSRFKCKDCARAYMTKYKNEQRAKRRALLKELAEQNKAAAHISSLEI